jgi:hypothetical protein
VRCECDCPPGGWWHFLITIKDDGWSLLANHFSQS